MKKEVVVIILNKTCTADNCYSRIETSPDIPAQLGGSLDIQLEQCSKKLNE